MDLGSHEKISVYPTGQFHFPFLWRGGSGEGGCGEDGRDMAFLEIKTNFSGESRTVISCDSMKLRKQSCCTCQLPPKSLKDWSLLIPGTGAEGNITFSPKKLITHPNFPSNFHTRSENLPKCSYPNVYKLLCVDNFYNI